MLSHYWSNKRGSRVIETGDKSRRIKKMMTADYIVRNDEVVGSSPTSSTIFPSTCRSLPRQSCQTSSSFSRKPHNMHINPFSSRAQNLLHLIAGVVPAEKFLHSGFVAERFRAATVGGGECSAQISVGQARREIRSAQKLVEQPGVEAVTCANQIDDRYRHGGCAESVPIPNSNGAAGAQFDHDGFHLLCEPRERGFHVVSSGHLHRFALAR